MQKFKNSVKFDRTLKTGLNPHYSIRLRPEICLDCYKVFTLFY